jgi:hypothetical protein
MASKNRPDVLRVVGALHFVWSLFDEQSSDGKLLFYTPDMLDEALAWPGFATAMINVDWLHYDGQTLEMHNFSTHNGQSARKRALDADRKREARASTHVQLAVRTASADRPPLSPQTVRNRPQNVRPREEKRREEKRKSNSDGSRATGDLENAVIEIAAIYPKIRDPHNVSQEVQHAIAEAVARHGRDPVWAGTKNMAEAVRKWEPAQLKFIPAAGRFFRESQYLTDPAEWERNSNGKPVGQAKARVTEQLDARNAARRNLGLDH